MTAQNTASPEISIRVVVPSGKAGQAGGWGISGIMHLGRRWIPQALQCSQHQTRDAATLFYSVPSSALVMLPLSGARLCSLGAVERGDANFCRHCSARVVHRRLVHSYKKPRCNHHPS